MHNFLPKWVPISWDLDLLQSTESKAMRLNEVGENAPVLYDQEKISLLHLVRSVRASGVPLSPLLRIVSRISIRSLEIKKITVLTLLSLRIYVNTFMLTNVMTLQTRQKGLKPMLNQAIPHKRTNYNTQQNEVSLIISISDQKN